MSSNNQKLHRNGTVFKIAYGITYVTAFCAGYTVRILDKTRASIKGSFGHSHRDDRGQALIEYGLIVALILIIVILTLTTTVIGDDFNDVKDFFGV